MASLLRNREKADSDVGMLTLREYAPLIALGLAQVRSRKMPKSVGKLTLRDYAPQIAIGLVTAHRMQENREQDETQKSATHAPAPSSVLKAIRMSV